MANKSKRTIDLSLVEELLWKLSLDCRNHILYNSHDSADLDIWFTGGWVRDKLLGGESHDIDVALSSMTGFQFAGAVDHHFHFSRFRAEYIAEAQRIGVSPTIKGLHKIEKKPEKSKQPDTATVEIFGMPVDFVNLRKEVYTDQSRDPQVKFGTVVDAFRRDVIINSIFYSLDRRQVEDRTQMGLSDLANGIIRTPLEPTQTFTDNPLLILRLIRIASRLGFQIDRNAVQAMKAPLFERLSMLKSHMSKWDLKLKKRSMVHIHWLPSSYSTVFLDRLGYLKQALLYIFPRSGPGVPWPTSWPLAFRNLASLLQNRSRYSKRDFWKSEARLHIWLMAAWAPLAPLRRANIEGVMNRATGAIKTTRPTSKILSDCLKNIDSDHATVQQVATDSAGVPRSSLGMTIRSEVCRGNFKCCMRC